MFLILAPNDKMKDVLMRTVEEAKALICKVSFSAKATSLPLAFFIIDQTISYVALILQKQVQANVCVTMEMVKEALDQLRGAVMIVYPMGLPPHDPIRMEFEEQEDLSGTQVGLLIVFYLRRCRPHPILTGFLFSFDRLCFSSPLSICLLSSGISAGDRRGRMPALKGQGAPAREPLVTDEQHKQMMLHQYRRQEELKKLEEADDDSYLDSEWSNRQALKRQFQGLTNIKWGPRVQGQGCYTFPLFVSQ
ncbi:hypothetical protein XENOCAPTIV_022594 [Xenoophorus captivus]|uniref:Uncharacterized protein n=1 Tax=Xenoophorus captivus TaxID=1517983 RepID=A0ABV0SB70_9TELE